MGRAQPWPHRGGSGAKEGVVAPFSQPTRALPLAGSIVDVGVEAAPGGFTIHVDNVSDRSGSLRTDLPAIFWAVHDANWTLFEVGRPALTFGLERFAEDGDTSDLLEMQQAAPGVLAMGGEGPVPPGSSLTFFVPVDPARPFLMIAAQLAETNDAFVAVPSRVVRLVDLEGRPRDPRSISNEIKRRISIWDAGTERNQIVGAGGDQQARQSRRGVGARDEADVIRRYMDATDDLSGPYLGGRIELHVNPTEEPNGFALTLRNTSGEPGFPILSPLVWATHGGDLSVFRAGAPASFELERLAEDGDPWPLAAAIGSDPASGSSGVASEIRTGGAIGPAGEVQLRFQADPEHPFLSLFAQIGPSNDAFLALGPGIRLFDGDQRRSDREIAAEVYELLTAWDAGTEQNQSGAAGPDQGPIASSIGPVEGDRLVRPAGGAWAYPNVRDLVRVTITPIDLPAVPADLRADVPR
jgi:hypothetical protein